MTASLLVTQDGDLQLEPHSRDAGRDTLIEGSIHVMGASGRGHRSGPCMSSQAASSVAVSFTSSACLAAHGLLPKLISGFP